MGWFNMEKMLEQTHFCWFVITTVSIFVNPNNGIAALGSPVWFEAVKKEVAEIRRSSENRVWFADVDRYFQCLAADRFRFGALGFEVLTKLDLF